MPKLSPEQQAARRLRIVDAAERCFSRNGFHRTTMQDICKEAGISPGALYLYFDSKEALIEALTERDREQFAGHFANAGEGDDFAAVLEHVFRVCVVDQPPHKSALCIEIGAESTRNPAIAATMRRFDESLRASLMLWLGDAQRKGLIDPVQPLEQALTAAIVIADGFMWRRAVDQNFDVEAAAPLMTAMISSVLRPVKPAPNAKSRKTPHKAAPESVA